jgi:hypothetical protein
MADIEAALAEALTWVGTIPGVVAVGEGRSDAAEPTVDVWVTEPVALPAVLGGVAVRVFGSEPFEAFDTQ